LVLFPPPAGDQTMAKPEGCRRVDWLRTLALTRKKYVLQAKVVLSNSNNERHDNGISLKHFAEKASQG